MKIKIMPNGYDKEKYERTKVLVSSEEIYKEKYKNIPRLSKEIIYSFDMTNLNKNIVKDGTYILKDSSMYRLRENYVLCPDGYYLPRRSYRNKVMEEKTKTNKDSKFYKFMEGSNINKDIGKYPKGTKLFVLFQEPRSTIICPDCGIEYIKYDIYHKYSVYHQALLYEKNFNHIEMIKTKFMPPKTKKPKKMETEQKWIFGRPPVFDKLYYYESKIDKNEPKREVIKNENFDKIKKILDVPPNWMPHVHDNHIYTKYGSDIPLSEGEDLNINYINFIDAKEALEQMLKYNKYKLDKYNELNQIKKDLVKELFFKYYN